MELDILNLFKDKSLYTRFSRFINKASVSKETYTILEDLAVYYETEEELDWVKFAAWFFLVQHSTMKIETTEIYKRIFDRADALYGVVIDPKIIEAFIARSYADKVVEVSSSVAEGGLTHTLDEVDGILSAYRDEVGKAGKLEDMFVTHDIHVLSDALSTAKGYKWRLAELNAACGSLRIGDFIIISARPDSGKTTMLASEATFMAPQMEADKHVLWFNNEEMGEKVQYRIMQSALGITREEFEAKKTYYYEKYADAVGRVDRIKVLDNALLHKADIEEILRNYKAGLIIIDQLWKVKGFEKEATTEVDRQTRMFAWARSLAKIHCPVVTVHQADGSAEGQLWIEMNQLYGSKTGIQGEADAIITLGRSHESGYENIRGLYVPKNKMVGDDPAFRNGKFEITIQGAIGRFKGEL
jgi:replicative DNA helicase